MWDLPCIKVQAEQFKQSSYRFGRIENKQTDNLQNWSDDNHVLTIVNLLVSMLHVKKLNKKRTKKLQVWTLIQASVWLVWNAAFPLWHFHSAGSRGMFAVWCHQLDDLRNFWISKEPHNPLQALSNFNRVLWVNQCHSTKRLKRKCQSKSTCAWAPKHINKCRWQILHRSRCDKLNFISLC